MNVQLHLNEIETYIGQYHILQGVSFEVKRGRSHCFTWEEWRR